VRSGRALDLCRALPEGGHDVIPELQINPDRPGPECVKHWMNAVDIGGIEGSITRHCRNGVFRNTSNRFKSSAPISRSGT
jgi:hypothetical protein